jgi:hypothetical protein
VAIVIPRLPRRISHFLADGSVRRLHGSLAGATSGVEQSGECVP